MDTRSLGSLSLVVRRTIRATPERLFRAWTTPDELKRWWGPAQVACTAAEVDLRVGGAYRIDNTLPDGSVVTILGEFEVVDPPNRLVYTWRIAAQDPADDSSERVTVRFDPVDGATEVVVIHERMLDERVRDDHRHGWLGCLDGLEALLGS